MARLVEAVIGRRPDDGRARRRHARAGDRGRRLPRRPRRAAAARRSRCGSRRARRPAGPSAQARWREIRVRDGIVHRPPGVAIDSGGLAQGPVRRPDRRVAPARARSAVDCAGDLRFRGPRRAGSDVADPFGGPHAARVRADRRRGRHERHRPAQLARRPRPPGPPPARSRDRPLPPTPASSRPRRSPRRRSRPRCAPRRRVLAGPDGRRRWLPHGGVLVLDDGRRGHPRGGRGSVSGMTTAAAAAWHRCPRAPPQHPPIAALVAAGVAASPAAADSIVYAKQGNLFLTSPDGSQGYQLTSDGGYSSPSQAADGTIGALHDDQLVRLDRSGHVLSAVDGMGSGNEPDIGGPYEPRISPDGTRFAYYFYVQTSFDDYANGIRWIDTGSYSTWTLRRPLHQPGQRERVRARLEQPEWVTDDRLLGTQGMFLNMWTWQLGTGHDSTYPAEQWWFGLQRPGGRVGRRRLPLVRRPGAQPRRLAAGHDRLRPAARGGRHARPGLVGRGALSGGRLRQPVVRSGRADDPLPRRRGQDGEPELVARRLAGRLRLPGRRARDDARLPGPAARARRRASRRSGPPT